MSTQSNLAYDLSRYENQVSKPEPQKRPEIKKRQNPDKSVSVFQSFIYVAILGAMIFCLLGSKMENSELCNQIASTTKQLDVLHSENVRMKAEIDGRTSLKNVEDYAENVLGLQKLEKSQIDYVQFQKDNVIEVSDESQNVFVKIKNKFFSILEYLKG